MEISITDIVVLIHFRINCPPPTPTLTIQMQSDRAQSIVSDPLVFVGGTAFDLFGPDYYERPIMG